LRGFSSAGLLAAALLAALPAAAEEIVLDTGNGSLAGTLERASGARPAVCALIIAGSGPTDRDGNQPGLRNDSLKLLALGLAQRGICTLRYDKRGVGASAAALIAESSLRFEDYVADAAAWVPRLARIGGAARVAAVGHSEGALVALLAARRGSVSAVVSIAGAGRPAAELIREQLQRLPADMRRRGEDILDELVLERPVREVPAEFGALFRPSVQPYLMSWSRYDPAAEARAPGVPLLIVQGTADLQVPVADAKILAAANPLAALSLIPDMNHVLKRSPPGEDQRAAYSDASIPIDPRVVDAIAGFLLNPP
jgi:hypothetical protein